MMQLITNEADYKGGWFAKIPPRVPGYDTLLIGNDGIPRLADDYLTVRDIRKGDYNRIARVSKATFSTDISIKVASKNIPYEFDVTVGVDYKVANSVTYYMSRSSYSIEGCLYTGLSRIVAPVAKRYEIADESTGDGLLLKLQERKSYLLETVGVAFAVISVDARPDAKAEEYVKKMTDIELTTMVEQHRQAQSSKLRSRNLEEAIIGQVVDGTIDMRTALEQLNQANRVEGYNRLEDAERFIAFVRNNQLNDSISDSGAEQMISEYLRSLPMNMPNDSRNVNINTPRLEDSNNREKYSKTINDLF